MTDPQQYDYLIVGAGLSGATFAQHAAESGASVLVIDKRDHIGGNVYDYIDPISGIRVSKYGAHLFHTNDEEVWSYIQRFANWVRWEHKVVAKIGDSYVPVPVNCTTVNMLCNQAIQTDDEMREWLRENQEGSEIVAKTSEDMALARVGRNLYEKLFRTYTKKQWEKEPAELEPSVLARIPVRCNFDDRYFNDKYQGLPINGYTEFVQQLLNSPRITVRLNTSWEEIQNDPAVKWNHVIFSGPIDTYFKSSGLDPLEYRSIDFHMERLALSGYAQPNSVVNYPDATTEYTRCIEYKHFLHQKSNWTILVKETTTANGDPYYPVPTEKNRQLYAKYQQLAEKCENVTFLGRLASYKYLNMDQAIRCAIDTFVGLKKSTNTL